MSNAIRFVTVMIILFLLGAQGSEGQTIAEGMGIVQGIVSDTLDDPIAGARVDAVHFDTSYFDITDSLGRYTLTIPLEEGQDTSVVDLIVSKTGYLDDSSAVGVIVVWGTITVVNFTLIYSAGPIYGYVLRNAPLDYIPGVVVSVVGNPALADTTDDYGYYCLNVDYPGVYDIEFACKDYGTERENGVSVGYGDTVRVDGALDRVVWHVSEQFGNDHTGDGSEFDAFATIQHAIDYTNSEDTVKVAPGIYTGLKNRDIDFKTNSSSRIWIVVESKDGFANTIIDCQADVSDKHRGFELKGNMDSRNILSGFTIINGYEDGGGISIKQESSPTIENCRFINNESGEKGAGISVQGRSYPLIRFCEFRDNTTLEDGGAIGIFESGPIIKNCTIIDNEAARGGGIAILYIGPLDTVKVTNCIIRGNSDSTAMGQVNVNEYSIAEINYCDIEDTTWPGVGNFDGDPYFCHADSFDFHLAENSCCRCSGQDSTFVGAYGCGCADIGVLSGTVTLCDLEEGLFGVDIQVTTNSEKVRSTSTDSSGHYRILVPDTPETVDIHFSHPEPTIADMDITDYYVLPGDSALDLDVCLELSGCNLYHVGDVNGDTLYNGMDIVYGVAYFKGDTASIPHDSCDCPPGSGSWYMVGDVNASCSYNGLDITYGTSFFKGDTTYVYPCPECHGAIIAVNAVSNRISRDPR